MFAVRVADRAVGLVSTMILARLLIPSDFGLVAMAMALLGMIELFSTFSFDLALIQNPNADRRHYDTAWTFTILFGALTAVVLVVLAIPAGRFFDEPRVEAVLYLVALGALVQGFQNIGIVAFRKELDFRKEFILLFIQKLLGAAIALTLAFTLRNYWALVLGALCSRVANVALSYSIHPYRPRFSLQGAGDLFAFSRWLLLNNVIVFGATRGYDLIIGRAMGAYSLGLYSVAYEISNLPTTELVFPVSRAVFPGFAKLSTDWERLRKTLLSVAALVALITIPIGAAIAVLAEPLVLLLLGSQWTDAIPLIRLLAIYGVVRALNVGFADAYLAMGLYRFLPLINLPHIVVGWPLVLYLLKAKGMNEAAFGILCAAAIGLAINICMALRFLHLRFSDVASCYWRPLFAALNMVAVQLALSHTWPLSSQMLELAFQSMILVIIGAITYGSTLVLLWLLAKRPEGAEKLIMDRFFMRKAAAL